MPIRLDDDHDRYILCRIPEFIEKSLTVATEFDGRWRQAVFVDAPALETIVSSRQLLVGDAGGLVLVDRPAPRDKEVKEDRAAGEHQRDLNGGTYPHRIAPGLPLISMAYGLTQTKISASSQGVGQ